MDAINDAKIEKIKKAHKIYADAMVKLAALEKDYESVLMKAKKRVTEKRLNQIRESIK